MGVVMEVVEVEAVMEVVVKLEVAGVGVVMELVETVMEVVGVGEVMEVVMEVVVVVMEEVTCTCDCQLAVNCTVSGRGQEAESEAAVTLVPWRMLAG